MNLHDLERRLDSRDPQPKLDPGLVVMAAVGAITVLGVLAVCGWSAAAWIGLPLAMIWLLERFAPWGER